MRSIKEMDKRLDEREQEIERLKSINEEHRILNGELRKELQQKENIIKEVREYIESFKKIYEGHYPYIDTRHLDLNKLLEILDKGE